MADGNTWDVYNEFTLHGGLDRFTKLLARYELFKLVMDKPGDIVECGVLKGAGVLYWAKLLQIYNPLSRRKVIGFDTFEGYPEDTSQAHDRQTGKEFQAVQVKEDSSIAVDTIMGVAEEQGLAHRIELVKGDATTSIQNYADENPGFRVALLDLDFVLYDPTKAALQALYPLIVPGGVVALDEYALKGMGESDAVDEFFEGQPPEMHSFPWALSPTAYFTKGSK